MTADELLRVIAQKTGFDPIEHNLLMVHKDGHLQYRLFGRVTGPHAGTWRVFLLHILRAARRSPWSIDISRTYMLRDMASGETTVVYAWRLVLQDRKKEHTVEHHFTAIRQAIMDYKPMPLTAMETNEVQLYGTKRNSGPTTGGGYASSVFQAVVGPAAVKAKASAGQ